jgi:tetratricopeptide (TPR) repeat protein
MKRHASEKPPALPGVWEPSPFDLQASYRLAIKFFDEGEFRQARRMLKSLLQVKSDVPEALSLLGDVWSELGRDDEAMQCYRRALIADPDYAPAEFNLGLALLRSGKWREGWKLFDARLSFLDDSLFPGTPAPAWEGQPLAGRSILVWHEQGFGDVIQFSRFLSPLVASGATVFFRCPKELARLFRRSFPSVSLVSPGGPYPAVDFECPLLSLARWMGNGDPALVAPAMPYLVAPPRDARPRNASLRVGVVWAGGARHANNAARSMNPERLLPLFKAFPSVEFVGIQPDAEPVGGFGNWLVDWGESIRDFDDTAAALNGLDLLISVDTATVHLAGAMGRPTWALLPFSSDWRWGRERSRVVWYPSVRLFRQDQSREWSGVVENVRLALKKFLRR